MRQQRVDMAWKSKFRTEDIEDVFRLESARRGAPKEQVRPAPNLSERDQWDVLAVAKAERRTRCEARRRGDESW